MVGRYPPAGSILPCGSSPLYHEYRGSTLNQPEFFSSTFTYSQTAFVDTSIPLSPQSLYSAKNTANLEKRTGKSWDIVWQSLSMDLSSRDEGGPFGTKISGGPLITWWGWTFRNTNSSDLSLRDEGGPFGTKKFGWTFHHVTYRRKHFRWTCHHVMRVNLPEQKNSSGPAITW